MKNYKQLVNELPSKSVVFTFGRFNPPTTGHELLIKVVRKLASQRKADHVVFVSSTQDSKKNPLDVTKKVQYLELLFPNTRFVPAKEEIKTFLDAARSLNGRYKNIVMVVGSDRVDEFKKVLHQYNGKNYRFETVDVVSAGERDPDSDDVSGASGTKMRQFAAKGDYLQFKRGLPTTVRDIDGKRLMNDIRCGMGLEPIKEQINLVKDDLREQYFRGEIFNEGDIVESNETVYKIIKRGSNHLLLQDETGKKVSKWIQDVQQTERQYMLEEKLITEDEKQDAVNQAAARGAKQAEDARKMLELKTKQAKQLEDLKNNQAKEVAAERSRVKVESAKYNISKSLMSLSDFRKTMSMGQKGVNVDNKETESDIDAEVSIVHQPASNLVGGEHMASNDNHSLRRMKVNYHLGEANYKGLEKEDKPGAKKTEFKGGTNSVTGDTVEGWKDEKKPVKEEIEINEEEFIAQVEADLDVLSEDDIFEAYDDEELAIIDEETGEELEAVSEEAKYDEPLIMEVLSRAERIKAKARLRRTQAKRQRRQKIAIRQLSSPQVANRRARRLAISSMKKRLLKGRNPSKVSVGEKERVERFIQQRKKIVDRLATRMVSRVKQIEKARLSHKKFTKPNNGVAF